MFEILGSFFLREVPEDVQVLIRNLAKVMASSTPSFSRRLRFVRQFDYILQKHKTSVQKFVQDPNIEKHIMSMSSGISNQDAATPQP